VFKDKYPDKVINSIKDTSDKLRLQHCVMLEQSMEQIATMVKAKLPKEEHKDIESIVEEFCKKLNTNNKAFTSKIDKELGGQMYTELEREIDFRNLVWLIIH
jgi:hypothetical protein